MDDIHAGVVKKFAKQIESGKVEVHREYSNDVMSAFPDDYLDRVYIDGDHGYQGVLTDLRLCYAKVKPGGLICGDDYRVATWWKDEVVRALHDFLHEVGAGVTIAFVIGAQFGLRRRRAGDVDPD